MMILVDRQAAGDQASAEDGHVDHDQLPHRGVVVGEHLKLGVEVEVQEDEARESRCRVAGRHAFETVVDLAHITCTDALVVHDMREPPSSLIAVGRNGRLADIQEMRSEAANEPFDEDLEDGGGDEGVEQADDGVVGVPEGADADLHCEDDEDGD